MATLTIRNLDEKVVKKLKKQAAAHNRSLEAEVRELLKQAAGRKTPAELRAIADRITAMTPGMQKTDSTDIIREFRDR